MGCGFVGPTLHYSLLSVGLCRTTLLDGISSNGMCDVPAVWGRWSFFHAIEAIWKSSSQSVNPIILNLESQVLSIVHFGRCINEVKNMDLDVK